MTQTSPKTGSAIVPAQRYAIVEHAADLGELLRENVGAGGLSPFDLDRVKIPGGGSTTWEIPTMEGPVESKELLGIIAAWADKRSYWANSMEESGGGSPPDCNSEDGITGVGSPGGDCFECPLAAFGSGKNNAQACKSMKFVFLISPERMLPILLAVPPSSLRPWKQYMLQLASGGASYKHVVTRFTLEKTKNAGNIDYSRLVPSLAERIDPNIIPQINEYSQALRPLISRIGTQRMDYGA